MDTKLHESQLNEALATLPLWNVTKGELVRSVAFKNFLEAIAFVNRVAELAEAAGHHPDIDIRYNKVRLALVTHDAGGITSKDIKLAQNIDKKN